MAKRLISSSNGNGASDVINNVIKFTELTASKGIQKAGIKAVSNYHARNAIITGAEKFDKSNTGKVLISPKVKNEFIEKFNGFNISNIDNGKTIKTCLGHKYYSKAGSCDIGILWCLYPNITTKTLVDMLTNHFGLHTKVATSQALLEKVKAHNTTKTTGSNYFLSNTFTSRLQKAGIIMNNEQRHILAKLSDEFAQAVLPRLKTQAKSEKAKIEKAKQAAIEKAKKAEADKKAIQPASQPKG